MGLSGCYALMKYLVVLVNLIFWVSTVSSYVFNVFCLKHAFDMLYAITVLCANSIPRNYFRRHIGCYYEITRGRIENGLRRLGQ
jgi:hypothetical protein